MDVALRTYSRAKQLVVNDSFDPVDQHSHAKSEGTEKGPKEWGVGVSFYSSISIVKDVASKRPLRSSNFFVPKGELRVGCV